MGTLLQFRPRLQANAEVLDTSAPSGPPPQDDAYKHLYVNVLVHCREMVKDMRATGKWDETCEDTMIQVVHLLRSICTQLAGPTGDSNGTSIAG